jgi:hypothetical protein
MNRTRAYALGSALATAAVGASLALSASSANAAPAGKTITVTVQRPGIPDTTVGSTATGSFEDAQGRQTTDPAKSVYGPVWAIDNINNDKFQITPLGGDRYQVDRLANGTFVAFAQPNTGLSEVKPLNNVAGQLHGTNSYVVTSTTGPVGPVTSPEPLGASSTDVLRQLFPGLTKIDGGNTWVFAYHTGTSDMVQRYDTDPSTWGNITG